MPTAAGGFCWALNRVDGALTTAAIAIAATPGTQRPQALRRRSGRRRERPLQVQPAEDEAQYLAILLALRIVHDERDTRKPGIGLERDLDQDARLAVGEPGGAHRAIADAAEP